MNRDLKRQKLAVLGSTGSIGKQTLEVVAQFPDLFEVTVLTANNNWQLLAQQALQFDVYSVVIANEEHYSALCEALKGSDIKVYATAKAVEQIVESSNITTVVSALVGFSGLFPTINGIKHGKKIALANKESLVVAGETVMKLAEKNKVPILPVDSEHSAIFQSLVGEISPVEKIILTASGGPFREWSKDDIYNATAKEALAHPTWVMGNKITIDSATLMNKGFEVIEAKWLFSLRPDQIDVVVHPSSIIHSMVQFEDGAIKAQLGTPDMKLPIQYALTFPQRLPMDCSNRLDFSKISTMHFSEPRKDVFPCLEIAYEVMRRGGNSGCVVNAANEVAVSAFLNGQIVFGEISSIIENCMNKINYITSPSLDDYRLCDKETREYAQTLIR